jgi:hypothetical protein
MDRSHPRLLLAVTFLPRAYFLILFSIRHTQFGSGNIHCGEAMEISPVYGYDNSCFNLHFNIIILCSLRLPSNLCPSDFPISVLFNAFMFVPILVILLLSSSSSSPPPPLCRVFIFIFLTQTMSLGNTVLQPFCCSYSWFIHR